MLGLYGVVAHAVTISSGQSDGCSDITRWNTGDHSQNQLRFIIGLIFGLIFACCVFR